MAPFPEDEIMTIKRLEVALRKSDFKLLKDGAYKLHEKYHSHHHFEYPDLLQIILDEVQANYAIPPDIKDILVPTIQDILSNQDDDNQNEQQARVSSLTSLSYGMNSSSQKTQQPDFEEFKPIKTEDFDNPDEKEEFEKPEEYIKPFQEFNSEKSIEEIPMPEIITEQANSLKENNDSKFIVNNFDAQPSEDFITGVPIFEQQNIFESKIEEKKEEILPQEFSELKEPENIEYEEKFVEKSLDEIQPVQFENTTEEAENAVFEEDDEPKEYLYQKKAEEPKFEEPKFVEPKIQEQIEEPEEEIEEAEEIINKKSVAIFFGQDSSIEKIKNIIKYSELIHSHGNFSLNEITALINEIKVQADTNVSELKVFLERLKNTNHIINLLTTSQSANLIDLFTQSDITYSIFNPTEEKRINLLPLMGLTNLYKCTGCENEFLENNEKVNSFILQCPRCKGAMLPNLYCSQSQLNMDYYNSSLIALANSDTWLLIHPSLSEKITLNMIRSALKVSSKVKEIYIFDKDINVRETYRKLAQDANSEIKVNINSNAMEEFFSNI